MFVAVAESELSTNSARAKAALLCSKKIQKITKLDFFILRKS
jgi:hypothetical protein